MNISLESINTAQYKNSTTKKHVLYLGLIASHGAFHHFSNKRLLFKNATTPKASFCKETPTHYSCDHVTKAPNDYSYVDEIKNPFQESCCEDAEDSIEQPCYKENTPIPLWYRHPELALPSIKGHLSGIFFIEFIKKSLDYLGLLESQNQYKIIPDEPLIKTLATSSMPYQFNLVLLLVLLSTQCFFDNLTIGQLNLQELYHQQKQPYPFSKQDILCFQLLNCFALSTLTVLYIQNNKPHPRPFITQKTYNNLKKLQVTLKSFPDIDDQRLVLIYDTKIKILKTLLDSAPRAKTFLETLTALEIELTMVLGLQSTPELEGLSAFRVIKDALNTLFHTIFSITKLDETLIKELENQGLYL